MDRRYRFGGVVDPVALALERIGRQVEAGAVLVCEKRGPIGCQAVFPKLSDSGNEVGQIIRRRRQGGNDRSRSAIRMLDGEWRERTARAHFEHGEILFNKGGGEGFGEMHGVAKLASPIAGIRQSRRIDRISRAGGNPWNVRRVGGNHRCILGEGGYDRLHHRGVECMRGLQQTAADFLGFEFLLIGRDGFVRSRNRAELRAVYCCQVDARRERQCVGSGADGEHAAAGEILH